jgi:hypothetical protein
VIDKGKKVEEGTHEELLAIPVTKKKVENDKDKDGEEAEEKIATGFYNNMWSTQMGEETQNFKLDTATTAEAKERVLALERVVAERQRELERWQNALKEQKANEKQPMKSAKSSQRLSAVGLALD